MRGQAGAAILFENLENFFAVAKGVEERRHGADVERVRAQPELMAGQAIQLGENYANVLRARRGFDVQKLFDRFAVAQAVRDRGHIIHAVDVWIEHGVGAVLGNFFYSAVEIADHALGAQNLLAVQLQDYTQYPVGRGMLRAHINDELVAVEKSFVGLAEFQVRDVLVRFGVWLRRLSNGVISHLLAALDSQVGLHPFLILLNDAVVFAQRMSLPAIGQQDALQIRMPVEADAEHVEDFALKPVGGCPDRRGTGNAFAVGDHDFHANAFVFGKRVQNPEEVELFFALGIVDCGDVHAVIELFTVAQNLQQFENNGGFDDHDSSGRGSCWLRECPIRTGP